jgi:cytidylate kinase
MAAGGETVGELVAGRLGFRYVDEQIVTLAARQAQVDPALVAAAEQRQRLLQRVLDKLPRARDLAGAVTLAPVAPGHVGDASSHRTEPEGIRVLIRAAIHEVARAGQAVIVAHAASMALAGVDGVLRVLVTASTEVRAKRLATAEGLSPAAAEAAIAASDLERRDYLKRFYGVKEELPTHYDLVINAEVLGPEQAAAAIVAAARGA